MPFFTKKAKVEPKNLDLSTEDILKTVPAPLMPEEKKQSVMEIEKIQEQKPRKVLAKPVAKSEKKQISPKVEYTVDTFDEINKELDSLEKEIRGTESTLSKIDTDLGEINKRKKF